MKDSIILDHKLVRGSITILLLHFFYYMLMSIPHPYSFFSLKSFPTSGSISRYDHQGSANIFLHTENINSPLHFYNIYLDQDRFVSAPCYIHFPNQQANIYKYPNKKLFSQLSHCIPKKIGKILSYIQVNSILTNSNIL